MTSVDFSWTEFLMKPISQQTQADVHIMCNQQAISTEIFQLSNTVTVPNMPRAEKANGLSYTEVKEANREAKIALRNLAAFMYI